MDINANIAKCIEHTNDFGSTVIHNICNGTTQVVPWGSLDWTLAAVLGTFAVVVIAMFGGMAVQIAKGF
jgi:hypothetical protein